MSQIGPPRGKVLVLDDDPAIRGLLERVLVEEGFRVESTGDVDAALASVADSPPDLVLLDVMLEGYDGLDVLTRVRRTSEVPVILLTAKGEETDRIIGLKLGADDYVVKPFSPGELAARIGTVLRRSRPPASTTRLEFEGLTIDVETREVHVEGTLVDTTAKEFDLLAFLAASPRQVFSRAQLLTHVWNSSAEWQDAATVTEHVRRVRRRIENDPDRPRWIKTVRGVGYRFEP